MATLPPKAHHAARSQMKAQSRKTLALMDTAATKKQTPNKTVKVRGTSSHKKRHTITPPSHQARMMKKNRVKMTWMICMEVWRRKKRARKRSMTRKNKNKIKVSPTVEN